MRHRAKAALSIRAATLDLLMLLCTAAAGLVRVEVQDLFGVAVAAGPQALRAKFSAEPLFGLATAVRAAAQYLALLAQHPAAAAGAQHRDQLPALALLAK
jgi:hypothetical protein